MENQKKVRKHRLVESHPVLASILACILLFFLCQLIQIFVDRACTSFISGIRRHAEGRSPAGFQALRD